MRLTRQRRPRQLTKEELEELAEKIAGDADLDNEFHNEHAARAFIRMNHDQNIDRR